MHCPSEQQLMLRFAYICTHVHTTHVEATGYTDIWLHTTPTLLSDRSCVCTGLYQTGCVPSPRSQVPPHPLRLLSHSCWLVQLTTADLDDTAGYKEEEGNEVMVAGGGGGVNKVMTFHS